MNKNNIKAELFKAGVNVIKILNYFGIDAEYKNHIKCPFHDDRIPSMLINENESVHCFGCDLHLDFIELYAALKTGDLNFGKFIWESDELNNILGELSEDIDLNLKIDINSGYIRNEKDEFYKQLEEMGLEVICDSLYLRNYAMADLPFSPLKLDAKSIYIYKNPITKEPLVIKVRYETYVTTDDERVLYIKDGKDYIEDIKVISEKPLKRKSFRFYNIVDRKVVKEVLPESKKEIIYNGEKIIDIVNDDYKRNTTWIWFLEGEKDVESLREYGFVGCSLMKGAGSKWCKEYSNLFRGCKVIISADFDEAGLKYEKTLFEALSSAKYVQATDGKNEEKYCTIGLKRFNNKFYEIDKMPPKSDITDLIKKWKLDGLTKEEIIHKLNEIIDRSIDYKDKNSIVECDKGLYLNNKKIADFNIVDTINIVSKDNIESDRIELTIKGTSAASKNEHTRIACIHEMFGSADGFNKTFSVMDCTFLGSKEDLFKLKKFILTYKIFHNRFMYSTNGMYKHQGEWITVTPDGALRRDGTWDKDVFSSNTIMYNDLHNASIPVKDKINEIAPALLNFNTKEIVFNVLGEVGCKLLNARYKELGIKNHLLGINGTKGAGKTETSVKVIAALTNNNTRGEYNLTGQSNFTFLKNVSSNNIGGMILQELKLGKMSDYEKNKWSEIFRNNYDRAKSQRGTKDQELNQYEQSNPIITTGEEGIGEESALYERFNLIFMTAEKRNTDPKYCENFRILCDNQKALRGIGKELIIDIMNLTDDEIKCIRRDIERKIRSRGLDKKGFIDRMLNNVINVIHGFIVLSNTLKKLGYIGEINIEDAFDTIISNFEENILRVNDDTTAADDYQKMLIQYQKALDNDYNDKVVGEASNAYYVYKDELWIAPTKLRTVIAHFVQDCKLDTIILSDGEFRKNLIKAGYISEDKSLRKKFNQTNIKGWYYKVNICNIKKIELSFIDELIERNEILDPYEFSNSKDDNDVIKVEHEISLF